MIYLRNQSVILNCWRIWPPGTWNSS